MSPPAGTAPRPLPAPWRWRDQHWKLMGGGPLFTGFAVALWVIWVVFPQDVAPVAGLSAVCLALSVPGWMAIDERRCRVRGLESVPGPPPALVVTGSWWRVLAGSAAVLVVGGLWSAIVVVATLGGGGSPALALALGPGLWVALLLAFVVVNLRRGRLARPAVPFVALDAEGVVVRGLLHRTRLSWDDRPRPVATRRHRLALHGSRERPAQLPVGAYATSRLVVGAAVEHYALHARDRHELGTVLAEERLRRGDFAWPYG